MYENAIAATLLARLTFFGKAWREKTWNPALTGLALFTVVGLAETSWFMFEANYFLLALTPVLYGLPLSSLDGSDTLNSSPCTH